MKGFSILPVVLLILAAGASAPVALSEQAPSQTAAAPQNKEETPFILVELSGSLNAKKLKPGDTVRAQVAQDVLSHGKIVIPAESKLLGHVTEANARSENLESRLGLVFDKVLLKHHEEIDLQGVVHAVAPPVQKASVDETEQIFLAPRILPGQSSASSIDSTAPIGNTRGLSNQQRAAGPPGSQTYPDLRSAAGSALPGSPGYRPEATMPNTSAQNRSLTLGMRQGVFGLRGLSLSTEKTALTPGPVIVSKVADVKLESGTQVLVKITTPPTRP